jgi:hypothetical protein
MEATPDDLRYLRLDKARGPGVICRTKSGFGEVGDQIVCSRNLGLNGLSLAHTRSLRYQYPDYVADYDIMADLDLGGTTHENAVIRRKAPAPG